MHGIMPDEIDPSVTAALLPRDTKGGPSYPETGPSWRI